MQLCRCACLLTPACKWHEPEQEGEDGGSDQSGEGRLCAASWCSGSPRHRAHHSRNNEPGASVGCGLWRSFAYGKSSYFFSRCSNLLIAEQRKRELPAPLDQQLSGSYSLIAPVSNPVVLTKQCDRGSVCQKNLYPKCVAQARAGSATSPAHHALQSDSAPARTCPARRCTSQRNRQARRRSVTPDELGEPAFRLLVRVVLVEKGELVLLEGVEELVPRDLVE